MSHANYLDPTDETVTALFLRGIQGPVVMLNLLRFREWADYSSAPQLAPAERISGREAYDLYTRHTMPFLEASGGSLELYAEGGSFLVGPPGEVWDLAMLVRQSSVESFLAFASNEEYLAGIGHRTAAVEDSRILPLVEVATPVARG